MKDFVLALEEIKPAFGVDDKSLENSFRGGIYNHGKQFDKVFKLGNDLIQSIQSSSSANPLLSVLLEGQNGSGKTALAAKLALDSGFPYVKMISPEQFVGFTEYAKVAAIAKVFEDAYKSPLSLIVLDDIERLLEFVHIGPRFSNQILQNLVVLLKKKPPNEDRKLLVIGTTSMKEVLKELEVVNCFNTTLHVPNIMQSNELTAVLSVFNCPSTELQAIAAEFDQKYTTFGIPVKTLMLAIDLAKE
jgi:vesicle-fusing ATPase